MTTEKRRRSSSDASRGALGDGDRSSIEDHAHVGTAASGVGAAFLNGDDKMSALMRMTDWSQTPLGPVERWPPSLKTTVGMMLGAKTPLAIYWGDDLTFLYNDAWRVLMGDMHPQALGRPARELFSEAWETLAPIFERVMAGREAIRSRERRLLLGSSSGREEVRFNHTLNPIPRADGSVGGILDIVTATAEQASGAAVLRRKRVESERERLLAERVAAMESMTDALMLIDPSGRVTYHNPASLDLHGFDSMEEALMSRDQVLAQWEISDLSGQPVPVDEWPMMRALRGDTFSSYELCVRRVDTGKEFIGSYSGTLVRRPQGDSLFALLTVRDISERVRAEEELRRSQMDLHRAQEVGRIGSWRLDVRADVLTWSDEAYRIFGIPQGRPLTYETFLEMVHPDDRVYVDAQWQAALDGAPYDIEHRIIKDGEVRWVREKAYLEYDDSGGLLGGFGITQDITERKEAEKALRHYAEELEELNEANRLLLREVNHRVKNTLASIMGMIFAEQSRIASNAVIDAEAPGGDSLTVCPGRYRAVLDDLIKRVHSLATVHDLLSAGGWRPLRVDELVEKVVRGSLPSASLADEVALEVRTGEVPVAVSSDQAHHVALVVGELTTNSLKYGATEGGLRIRVDVGLEDGHVWMVYRDRGPGYPAPVLAGERRSVGLELVQMIVTHSLEGTWAIKNEGGAVTEIRFPRAAAV